MKQKRLWILPNPYTVIHRLQGETDGFTWAGLVPCHQGQHVAVGVVDRYVGATLKDATQTRVARSITMRGAVVETGYPSHDLTYEYTQVPVEVPNDTDGYYLSQIGCNDSTGHSGLIAADKATAAACGISEADFVDPYVLLEQLRVKALKDFAAGNHDVTLAELEERLPAVIKPQTQQTTRVAPSRKADA